MMRNINGYVFDFEAVNAVKDQLINLEGINDYIINKEAVAEVRRLLKLDSKKNIGEIRAIRNAVIDIFDKMISEILHIDEEGYQEEGFKPTKEDMDLFRKLRNVSSAVTAVCDEYLPRY